tara:strand:- start:302 stop:1471 length:1170 start_codon:yes stop_codon:yes gene_type:complete
MYTTKKTLQLLFLLIVSLVVSLFGIQSAFGEETDSIREAREKREDAASRAADAAEALEFVEAQDAEVAEALRNLDGAVALQEALIEEARRAIEAAEAEATLRWVEAETVTKEIKDLRRRLRELAIDVYISTMKPGIFLESSDMSMAIRKSAILDAITGDRGDLVDQLRALESDQEDIARFAEKAISDAERRQKEIESQLVILESRIVSREEVQMELRERADDHQKEVDKWDREKYLMAVLIDNLIAEELRRSAPDLTKESGQGFIMPVEGKKTSDFGMRMHPIFGVERMHNGVDFQCVIDQPVWAAKSGTVIFAGWREGYGNVVILEHEGPVLTLYAHLNELLISKGISVDTGGLIGKCGSTGWSTGPHLHFEVRTGGEAKDPFIVLPD